MIKIVFCGSPEFAAIALRYLITQPFDIRAVVTMPDKKTGRGQRLTVTPVKSVALKHNLHLLQPDRATDPSFLSELRNLKPDVIAVTAYGKILRPQFLAIPKYACINLHASLLPKYRGASPIHTAILNGDTETGLTTFIVEKDVDSGPMILKCTVPIDNTDTLGTLHNKLAHAGSKLLTDTLRLFENGMPPTEQQQNDLATFTSKISHGMTRINWTEPAEKIRNKIRAFNPIPGAYSPISIRSNKKTMKIFYAETTPSNSTESPGTLIDIVKNSFTIQCGIDALRIIEVQLEGKKHMTTTAFLRGYPLTTDAIISCM